MSNNGQSDSEQSNNEQQAIEVRVEFPYFGNPTPELHNIFLGVAVLPLDELSCISSLI